MLLNKVKSSLRISHDLLDGEIEDLIEAAKLDLKISGVVKEINELEPDPLLIRAVTVYCKSHFGLENKDSEKYQRSYDMLKNHLSLSGDYSV